MAISSGTFQNIMLAGLALLGTIGVAALVNDASISGSTAKTQADVENVEKRLDDQIRSFDKASDTLSNKFERMESRVIEELRKTQTSVAAMQQTINASQLDIGKMLVSMGVAREDQIYASSVIHGKLFVFPSPEIATQLEGRGLKRQSVTENLSGYAVFNVVDSGVGSSTPDKGSYDGSSPLPQNFTGDGLWEFKGGNTWPQQLPPSLDPQ